MLAANTFVQDISNLPDTIKNNTIILIGPMGTGKSTIAKILVNKMEDIDRIPLDSKGQLKGLYERRNKFSKFKNFEFVLTGTVLSSLNKPHVIDFGAGHSMYRDKRLKEQMKKCVTNLKMLYYYCLQKIKI